MNIALHQRSKDVLPIDVCPIDLLILSNGPGEVMTWVRPMVKALRSCFNASCEVRISVVLAPCPHASGQEAEILKQFPEVDRVQGPEAFWGFVWGGRTAANWDWYTKGAVLFLGGEQFFAIALGKRLGYKIVTYAEWKPRWMAWVDGCGVAQESLLKQVPVQFRSKVQVVGDLISEAQALESDQESIEQMLSLSPETELLGMLPGSKPAKLILGIPLGLAIADYLHRVRPQVQMVIPVAPTLTLNDLRRYADPATNPSFNLVEGCQAELVIPEQGLPYFLTVGGARVFLWQRSPAYDLLVQCRLCLTTVGANTAELASLSVPMLVLLPTQQLDIMRAWDGIPGLLANLPLLGTGFAKLINQWVLSQGLGLRAWPNIWAGREIVPEWVGHLLPEAVGDRTVALLADTERLATMRMQLKQVRGKPGAAQRLAALVQQVLSNKQPH